MKETIWNPWHGCIRYSEGCRNCYVYRRDESVGRDASEIRKTLNYDLPIRKNRRGEYQIPSNTVLFICMTSDFFLDKADGWRAEIWKMIKCRPDLRFLVITKRIERAALCLPEDWGEGYPNVSIGCTIENQRQCDIRLPVYAALPCQNKWLICEPLLSDITFGERLASSDVKKIICGGESGPDARLCRYDWILHIRSQCEKASVGFYFKQTGATFEKNGRLYRIPRQLQHSQAQKANINLPEKQ